MDIILVNSRICLYNNAYRKVGLFYLRWVACLNWGCHEVILTVKIDVDFEFDAEDDIRLMADSDSFSDFWT